MPKIPKGNRSNVIEKNFSYLLKEIDAKYLCPLFFERSKINIDEMEEIEVLPTSKKRNIKFLGYVKERDPNLQTFIQALRKNGDNHVVDKLLEVVPRNEDQPTPLAENENERIEVSISDMLPASVRGKLVFMSKEYWSDSNHRFCWLYFYLPIVEETMKVVLFKDDIDKFSNLKENAIYELNCLELEVPMEAVYHKDIRQTFSHTAKLVKGSSISECDSLQSDESFAIPDLQYINIQQAKKLDDNEPVHIKALVQKVKEVEKCGAKSTPTLPITIKDDTGRMIVRMFEIDADEDIEQRYLNKEIQIDYAVTKTDAQKGNMEIHVSRFTSVQLHERDPGKYMPDFNETDEEELEPDFIEIEDLIRWENSVIVRTKAYVLAVRYKTSPLVIMEHRKCKAKIELLPNGRINCTKCNKCVRIKKCSWAYDMRARIGRRKPYAVDHWMTVNKTSAEAIMGLSAEEFSKCKEAEKVKMIKNLRSKLFELKIIKKRSSRYAGSYFYIVIKASDDVDSSEDGESDEYQE